jgi:hypothetical protein
LFATASVALPRPSPTLFASRASARNTYKQAKLVSNRTRESGLSGCDVKLEEPPIDASSLGRDLSKVMNKRNPLYSGRTVAYHAKWFYQDFH